MPNQARQRRSIHRQAGSRDRVGEVENGRAEPAATQTLVSRGALDGIMRTVIKPVDDLVTSKGGGRLVMAAKMNDAEKQEEHG